MKRKFFWGLSSLLCFQLLFPGMIAMVNASQTYGQSLTSLNGINFVNEKIQMLEEEDLETSKTGEIFVSIANDFQKYYDSLKPSILVKVLEESHSFENQGTIKVLGTQTKLERKIKSESSVGGNPAKDEELLLRITMDTQKKEILFIKALENGVVQEIERKKVEPQECNLIQKNGKIELGSPIVLGEDIAEIGEKTGNLNLISNQNNPKKVKNVQILTSISKNDESLFSEILKRNLVTIDRIRDKLTFYTCAQ